MFGLEDKNPHILVIGDLMIDHYVWAKCERISPEAPVQIAEVKDESNRLGGACNVGNNLVSLGAKVSMCGVIGNDDTGKWLVKNLDSLGIDIQNIFIQNHRPTTKKTRVIVSNQQVLRVDKEDKSAISEEISKEIFATLEHKISNYDCIILSDYNKGVLNSFLTQKIIKLARSENKLILCDPKGNDFEKYKGATLLTPNKNEAQIATKTAITDDNTLTNALKSLKKDCNLSISLITLSEDGIALLDKKNKLTKIPTIAKEVYDVTGAGDTVIAALGFALSGGLDIYKACEFANAAAAVVVGKVGSAVATHAEIAQHLHSCAYSDSSDKILSKTSLLTTLQSLKNKKIIFTNGCFDILHRGHISYLQKAKKMGDILIVALNSDASVKRLKGKARPINPQDDRAYILSALECVDFIVIFDEDTPEDIISLISPDVLVKGKDYEGKQIAGSKYAKETRLIDFVDGISTTNILNKAKLI
ncbi:D-glycero-beta-D-manno-heptose-7-phosphate kinase [Helicobacter cappadocius]|uniref:Bifunctional protein HldE n=1 Tax=Helicobacter cappadocius TaxID=3063998 RepID=A0AA90PT53_9HELI|nr:MULTISPECIES: D-glycero-beta-D-manno-heptose-7-phosphate kinase [unclassified Helicobacter]MDO7253838.1 D-glycero-beta-D-manno-heptose-7-phosphate kinase [Helicobacter sp. faydin-H75]MDP2539727.1 D-glycero-beta-D-manno-heptose-7-phosphate kinase [Helicobacter sp. faydin-H76]